MARTLYPADRAVFGVPRVAGRPIVSRAGLTVEVFWDESRLIPADITDLNGQPISYQLITDAYSRLPEFLGPDDYDGPLFTDSGARLYPTEGKRGPEGEKGDPGPAGDIDNLSFKLSIATASTVWEGDHTLGFVPGGVQVQDQTGRLRFGFLVEELTIDHYRIVFSIPIIGTLILS